MKTSPVRDWELERYLLGELPEKRMNEIEAQIKTDSKLQERAQDLNQSNAEILRQFKPSDMTPKIIQRIKRANARSTKRIKPAGVKRVFFAVPAISAAMIFLFLVISSPNQEPYYSLSNGTRIKGAENIDRSQPHLLIYRKKDRDADLLKEGDEAKAGDLLQIAYGAADKNYGVILSIDGNGAVTLHYPENSADSALLGDQKIVLLSLAYELDEAPGFERFFFVTSESEIDVQRILDSARSLTQNKTGGRQEVLHLSSSFSQYSILLNKEIINE